MEERQLLAGDLPIGATPVDTGEFLLGTVTVTPVFFESDGTIDPETQDWTETEITDTLLKIRESVDWWSDLLATKTTKHSLSFEIDDTYARNPVETGYEPIDNPSSRFQSYVGDWLTDLGYGDAPSIERAVHLFNDSQRQTHETDWAFTIFVVDSSDDDDGFFASGSFIGAFAYSGGLFYVVPSGRPVSTYSHEMGHIFYARDEYSGSGASWEDKRGYYNAQNVNAVDNPTPGFVQQDSIMRGGAAAIRAYDTLVTTDSTLALLGWQDSDGDGVFDVADVPLHFNAIGSYNIDSEEYSIRGSASVATLANVNSEGMQSDITLAQISALQYKIDDGDWQTAITPEATQVDFDLAIPINSTFDLIQWRVIDTSTGVSSEVLSGDALNPVISGLGGGFAYVDVNGDGNRDIDEALLDGTQFTIRRADGSDLFHRNVQASDEPTGELVPPSGLTFLSTGDNIDGRVASLQSTELSSFQVLQAFDSKYSRWHDTWGAKRQLEVSASESTGRVEIDFIAVDTGTYGLEGGSYARVEAYDSTGTRINRVTSDWVTAGEQDKLVIEDSAGRIARVIVFGHSETEILITGIEFGSPSLESESDDGGVFSVDGLADGAYSVEIASPNLIYQFQSQQVAFNVSGGAVSGLDLAAAQVDSPRYNPNLPGDVNGDQEITVRDALVVINDLGRLGNRTLTADEANGTFVDVNNDGRVSTIDALRVINILERAGSGEGEQTSFAANTPQKTHLTQGTHSANSALFDNAGSITPQESAVSLVPSSVDRFFRGDFSEISDDPQIGWDRENPKMLNSAGERTSDQSPKYRPSDRTLGTDVLDTRQNGEKASSERFVPDFLIQDSDLQHEIAAFPSPDELF